MGNNREIADVFKVGHCADMLCFCEPVKHCRGPMYKENRRVPRGARRQTAQAHQFVTLCAPSTISRELKNAARSGTVHAKTNDGKIPHPSEIEQRQSL
jgi:hypothetical protein